MNAGEVAAIFGEDFITPHRLMRASRFVYRPEEIEAWSAALPSAETVERLRNLRVIVVPPPPVDLPLSLRELDIVVPGLFSKGVKQALREAAYAKEVAEIRRPYVLRKGPLPRSKQKGLSAQAHLPGPGEELPTALHLAWALCCFNLVTDNRLYEGILLRTATGCEKERVIIGNTAADGCVVRRGILDSACRENLAITSMWQC